ncbi:MAG: VanZ family protein, partial [Clostridia bacterium]|nr:VanZ family protein [Clostridia bacterium]
MKIKITKSQLKTKVIRVVLLALIIFVMVIIFVLSAQDSTDSSTTSGGITELIFFLLGIDGDSLTEAEFIEIEGIIRTAAHFSEYALLAFLTALWLST